MKTKFTPKQTSENEEIIYLIKMQKLNKSSVGVWVRKVQWVLNHIQDLHIAETSTDESKFGANKRPLKDMKSQLRVNSIKEVVNEIMFNIE